jgi:uncharacterized protein (UPF0264 family)
MTQPGRLAHFSAPGLLVSVRDAREADLAATAGPCLVDAKDPGHGALGALPIGTVAAIVAAVDGRCPTSAVAGEPESWDDLAESVARIAASGVNMVKVAWPRGGGAPPRAVQTCLRTRPCPTVAVLFAEAKPGPSDVRAAVQAGFSGAMIDTSRKDGRTLLDHLSTDDLEAFVGACRQHDIVSGLAGSLRIRDIAALNPLSPTYLGFRGGLCRSRDREGDLDGGRIAEALSTLDALRHVEAVA